MRSRGSNVTGDAVPAGLVAAGVFGASHAGFSIYWSIGGTWLLSSLGSTRLTRFQGWEWTPTPIGLAKLIGALAPIALARKGWPVRLLTRSACWLGRLRRPASSVARSASRSRPRDTRLDRGR
ncbi:MAG: hypothetical protein LH624_05555 [Cryobacterium sp.]|nr:hypothetical protein [Cryobacterium sp.]